MVKCRKKPVEVEAYKISDLIHDATNNWDNLPERIRKEYYNGNLLFNEECIHINTLEGGMYGNFNDWLIIGVKGEMYPIKDDIFKLTYDLVPEMITCPECAGAGQLPNYEPINTNQKYSTQTIIRCQRCRGKGKITKEE